MGVVGVGSITLYDQNDSPVVVLSNDAHPVPCNADGTNPDLSGAVSTLSILLGGDDISSFYSVSAAPSSGITGSLSTRTYTVTGMSADTGYVDFTAIRAGWPTFTKRFSLAKQKQGLPGAQGVDAPECLGLFSYADRALVQGMESRSLAVFYSADVSERGIYQYSASAWNKLTNPTPDQVGRCFLFVLDAVRLGYGISSHYIGGSTAFETLLVKFLYALRIKLETNGAIFSGGYNEYGDIAKDGQGNDIPGAYIGGSGAFGGVGAVFKSLTANNLSTLVKYSGSWVYGSWGGQSALDSSARDPSIVPLPDGRAVCVYEDATYNDLVERVRPTAGSWGAKTIISTTRYTRPSLCAFPDSRVLCLFNRDSDQYLLQNVRDANGGWGAESVVNSYVSQAPSSCLLSDGRVLCVYYRPNIGLCSKVRNLDGSWSGESSFSGYLQSSLVLLPDNTVLCVYLQLGTGYLAQRIYSTGGTWGGESVILSDNSTAVSMTMVPDGDVLLAFRGNNGKVSKMFRTPSGTWGSPTGLAPLDMNTHTDPSVCVLRDGRMVCVYTRSNDNVMNVMDDSSYYSSIPIGDFLTQVGAGIQEIGQNSNGVYLKFSDGTLIQYGERMVPLNNANYPNYFGSTAGAVCYGMGSFYYPTPFASSNIYIFNGGNTGGPTTTRAIPSTTTGVVLTWTDQAGYPNYHSVYFLAIGWWK